MLKSPNHVALGVSNIEQTARFFQTFGFVREADTAISAFAARQLYGLGTATWESRLVMPGAAAGFLRLIHTPGEPVHGGTFDRGAHAIDLYVRDMDQALNVAKNTHAAISAVAAYKVGLMTIKECKCVGPDGIALVLIAVDKMRPSLLSTNPAPLFSEVHSAVTVVDSIDAAAPFWKQAGLTSLLDATFAEPSVNAFMGLPRPDTRLRLILFADPGQAPIRLEMIEFPDPDGRGAPLIDSVPLRPGRFTFGFEVDSPAHTAKALSSGTYSQSCRVGSRTVIAGLAPGGVRFELWSPA